MTGFKQKFDRQLNTFLGDETINPENRAFFKRFFELEEYKLKRTNSLSVIDDGVCKTLLGYISKFRNLNLWFENQPLHLITKEDIKRVYDGLEDGKILNQNRKPFKDRQSYYNKIFRSKPFEMLGKADIAREVIEFYKPNGDGVVKFIPEEDIRKMAEVIVSPAHKALFWLAFDVGENIQSLLVLTKRDVIRTKNEHTNEPEYLVNFRRETLKRSRTPRTEPTNFQETVRFLDFILPGLGDDEKLFSFGYEAAKKFFNRAVRITRVRCLPNGLQPTWKDLRSSMACDLLKKGWTRDEVNARLGHKPSSVEIDKYINYLAIDRKTPKKKIYEHQLSKLTEELEKAKERERLYGTRLEEQMREMERVKKDHLDFKYKVEEIFFKLAKSEIAAKGGSL